MGNFPLVAEVARRVLVIPATSAQSEPLILAAGLVVAKKRRRVGWDQADLLFLRTCAR